MTASQTRDDPIEILLVEDNPGDCRLTQEALKDSKIRNRIHVVGDGAAAMAFLRRNGSFADASRPDLILLDWSLPIMSGAEVLKEVKADPDLRRIPVVVLTSSDAERDILKAYDLNVNCYIHKPIDLDQFMMVVKAIENLWLSVVKLPGA